MFDAGVLTFREFVMREPLPLARIQEAVLQFLRNRKDVAVFGAQAVNAYVEEPRMTQDIDVVSTRSKEFATELCDFLADRFKVAVRVRALAENRGFRIYQVRRPKNRHLIDVRPVDVLPPTRTIGYVKIVAPAELIASKVIAFARRKGQPKSGTDWRDLAELLLAFPKLKESRGFVQERLEAAGVAADVIAVWEDMVAGTITRSDDD